MNYIKISTYFLTVFLLIAACDQGFEQTDSPVLARTGGETLTMQMALDEIPKSVMEQDSLKAIQSYMDQWIHSKITVQHAEKIGLGRSETVQKKLQRIRNQLLEEALKDYLLDRNMDSVEVTREEAQTYYQTHKDQFTLNEKFVRFRHITTRTRTAADNANRDLMRGIEWREILDNYSTNPDLQFRQSQQFWPISMAGNDIPMINRYLNVIGLSERSPIFYHNNQYHLVQLMEERPAGEHPDLDWLIPQIQEWLKLEKARRITNSYIRNLYLEANANNEISRTNVTDIESFISDHQ